jgi:flavin-binding protein dodecin
MTVAADEGKITEYRVDLKLAFALDAGDADDD